MINFTLPNSLYLKNANDFITVLARQNPKYLKYPVNICAEGVDVPYLSWNGGLNSNFGYGVYYNNLIDFQRDMLVPHRLNMANVLLEDYDYDDCFGQVILEIFHDGSTVIELSSIPLMEKINHSFPNYRFIFSKQADLINEFTPEILSELSKIEHITRIGIPDKYSYDKEWLNSLQKKSRYEITVNPYCPTSCDSCDVCLLNEHKSQLEYSNRQTIMNCSKRNDIYNSNKIISLDQIVKEYGKMGFSYFTFNFDHGKDLDFWVSFYVNYFCKPEYHNEIFVQWAKQRDGGVHL